MKKEEKQKLIHQSFIYVFLYILTLILYVNIYKCYYKGIDERVIDIIFYTSWNNEPQLFYVPVLIVSFLKIVYHWCVSSDLVTNIVLLIIGLFAIYWIMWFICVFLTVTPFIRDGSSMYDHIETYHYYCPPIIILIIIYITHWASEDDD